jgi:15-cis-phytoene synthase
MSRVSEPGCASPPLAPVFDDRDLQHCAELTRRHTRNFYYGLKLLPEPKRSAMYAVYAWMRRADDLADGQCASPQQQVDRFRRTTHAAMEGHVPEEAGDDPMWRAFAVVARRFNLDPHLLESMIDGQLDDLKHRRYATFDELREYCYRVASTVGLLCIDIWGYHDDAARDLAIERGIAFQLTNILRDFREDYDHGRVYLPEEDFARHGLTPADLRSWAQPDACRSLVLEQVERAEAHYMQSAPLDELISPDTQPTLWAMTRIYHGLLRKIAAHPQRIVSERRVRLSAAHKAAIALAARWKSRS